MDTTALQAEVREALEGDGWPIDDTDDADIWQTGYDAGLATLHCFVQFHGDGQLSFYVYLPRASQEQLADMGEFVLRANYGLILANLELDLDDGELRAKASVDLLAATPCGGMAVSAARAAAQTAEYFLPEVLQLTSG